LQAMASGGSGSYTFQWSSNPPGFTSTLPNPVVSPSQSTVYSVQVSDGYNFSSGNVTVSMHELPVPEAGNDVTIPHGTNTTLSGTASGGTGGYNYHWEPANKLVNPNVANPQTVNLYTTTLFSLTVTDLVTDCQSAAPDQMSVVISGGALALNPSAVPEDPCFGDPVQLFASAGGGSGTYSYNWSSDPPGFSSTDPNPVITPPAVDQYTYTCTVDDNYNIVSHSVIVTVRAIPDINFGFTEKTVCVFDTVTLDAGNPGSIYVWSNGSSERTIDVATTGIGFDLQTYSVSVTNPSGCTNENFATIIFDFSACTGIDSDMADELCRIYPNPGKGIIHIEVEPGTDEIELSVSNMFGQNVFDPFVFGDLKEKGGEILLSLADQPDGVYFIHLKNEQLPPHIYKYILRRR